MRRRISRFAGFEFSCERGLEQNGEDVALQPKARGLLELLLRDAGAIVPKETIAAALWTHDAPSDDSLARVVRSLRKALGADGSHIVRTIYGEGLKLACPVETDGEDAHDPAVAATLVRTAWEIAATRAPDALARAIEALRFTVARYPDHAPAWTLMADAIATQAILGGLSPGCAATGIAECCEKALGADPRCASALATSGWSLAMLCSRTEQGGGRIDEAIRMRPEWLSFYYRAWLRVDRRDLKGALADVEAALALSPLERGLLIFRAWLTLCHGKIDEADALARDALNVRNDIDILWSVRAAAACERGDAAQGVAYAERAAASTEPSRMALGQLAYAYAKAGAVSRARTTIEAIKARATGHSAAFLVAALIALGELAEAERLWLRAEEERCPWRVFGWCDPRLAPLRRAAQNLIKERLPALTPTRSIVTAP